MVPSASVAVAVKVTVAPEAYVALFAGAVILTTGLIPFVQAPNGAGAGQQARLGFPAM